MKEKNQICTDIKRNIYFYNITIEPSNLFSMYRTQWFFFKFKMNFFLIKE